MTPLNDVEILTPTHTGGSMESFPERESKLLTLDENAYVRYADYYRLHQELADTIEHVSSLQILADALNHILAHKEVGCDYFDHELGKFRNYPEVERDAMYQDALEALEKTGLLRPTQINEEFRAVARLAIQEKDKRVAAAFSRVSND